MWVGIFCTNFDLEAARQNLTNRFFISFCRATSDSKSVQNIPLSYLTNSSPFNKSWLYKMGRQPTTKFSKLCCLSQKKMGRQLATKTSKLCYLSRKKMEKLTGFYNDSDLYCKIITILNFCFPTQLLLPRDLSIHKTRIPKSGDRIVVYPKIFHIAVQYGS